ncbi:hypothetical protein [Methylobacterium aquaticum]|uniref:hypothetical protein n=1 Tax=Methylobacterium aquaticum TaxID=270351 RepID=UPI001933D1B0|nr:hypothetical protein [Methylobacterium aquaticum]QRE74389.1 hypothetical protein F1D61_12940 [Methylobacterium aquaticum]
MQDGFYKSRPIGAAIGGFLIAAFTGAGQTVAVAATAASPFAGVTDSVGGSGGLVDLQLTQEADVRYGGTVKAGDPLMAAADGSGRAVKATKPGAGATVNVIGIAQADGVADDIGKVLLAPSVLLG